MPELLQILIWCSIFLQCQPHFPCSSRSSVDITNGTRVNNSITSDGITYDQQSYFYNNNEVLGCICNYKKCLSKCCMAGETISIVTEGTSETKCVGYDGDFSVDIYNDTERLDGALIEDFHITHGIVCGSGIRVPLVPKDGDEFYLQEDGSVYLPGFEDYEVEAVRQIDEYCVDVLIIDGENVGMGILICGEDEEMDAVEEYRTHSTGMIISMPFLLVTFIIYTLLPERNLHMKALMSYVMSLFFGYIFLVTIQLYPNKFEEIACSLLGYLCIFAFMLSFYWMNVICVDIWFGFSNLRTFSRQRNSERRRFYFYCAYAWGMSILHIIIILCIQQLSWEGAWYSPGISSGQCFLASGYPELLYFYGPMGILITLNVIFFALTAARIRRVKQDTQMLKKNDSKRHNYENNKQKFNLYLKLLLAMGINWSMEIISWAVDWKLGSPPPYVWYLTDFCNAAYGVVIFFIFVFKRSIWRMLKKRYYTFIGKPFLAHSMTTTTQTRSTSYSVATTGQEMQPTANGTTALTVDTA